MSKATRSGSAREMPLTSGSSQTRPQLAVKSLAWAGLRMTSVPHLFGSFGPDVLTRLPRSGKTLAIFPIPFIRTNPLATSLSLDFTVLARL